MECKLTSDFTDSSKCIRYIIFKLKLYIILYYMLYDLHFIL